MIYYDEYDYRETKYPEGWISKKMAEDPRYNEKMQVFHRWCSRYLEYYEKQEYNRIFIEANERERTRRQNVRDSLKQMMDESYKDRKMPDSAKPLYEAVSRPVEERISINENYDPDWMDEELKEHGLYTPEMELVKRWLRLRTIQIVHNKVEGLRNKILEDELECKVEEKVELNNTLDDINDGVEICEED